MSLLALLVILMVIGVGLQFLPIEARVKSVIIAVVAIVAIAYVLALLFGGLPGTRVGRIG